MNYILICIPLALVIYVGMIIAGAHPVKSKTVLDFSIGKSSGEKVGGAGYYPIESDKADRLQNMPVDLRHISIYTDGINDQSGESEGYTVSIPKIGKMGNELIVLGERAFDLSEDKLLSLISHEYAHLRLDHLLKNVLRGCSIVPIPIVTFYIAVLYFSTDMGLWIIVLFTATTFIVCGGILRYTLTGMRQSEYEADEWAAERVGAIKYREWLSTIEHAEATSVRQRLWTWLIGETHPTPSDRIENIETEFDISS